MQLTYKAVALMCGYKMESRWMIDPTINKLTSTEFWGWKLDPYGFRSEEEAAKDCCMTLGLTKPEEE